MRKQWLIGATIAAAASIAFPAAASAEPWQPPKRPPPRGWTWEQLHKNGIRWELSYLALSAIDTAQTLDCLHRNKCSEGNPIFGSHPSAKRLIVTRVLIGAAHFAVFKALNDRNPINGRSFAIGGAVVEGGVVALNMRYTF